MCGGGIGWCVVEVRVVCGRGIVGGRGWRGNRVVREGSGGGCVWS